MGVNIQCFVFLSLLLFHYSESEIDVVATPPTLDIGLTSSLDVRCSYKSSGDRSLAALVSLILSRSDNSSNFVELASINVFLGQQVKIMTTEAVKGTGAIIAGGESFLNLHWDFPGEEVAGVYKCSAQGPDEVGHNIDLFNLTTVPFNKPDQDVLLNKIHEMDTLLKVLQDTVNELKTNYTSHSGMLSVETADISACCVNNDRRIADLEAHNARSDAIRNRLRQLLFQEILNGTYLLTKNVFSDVQTAEILCTAYNGYLAEFNTAGEFAAVRDVLLKNNTAAEYLYIGASKVGSDWKYRYNQKPVEYFMWADGEPKTESENECMFLELSNAWKMSSYKCASNNPIYALCELN